MSSRRKGRILAFQALYSWEALGEKGEEIPESILSFSWLGNEKLASLDEGIAAFSRLLITGTIENIEAVDAMIRRHLQNWKLSRLSRVDLAVLRMSAYSLMYQNDIPPSVVIDEAVGISREFSGEDSFRFVNGVLDSIRRTLQDSGGQEEGGGSAAPCPAAPPTP